MADTEIIEIEPTGGSAEVVEIPRESSAVEVIEVTQQGPAGPAGDTHVPDPSEVTSGALLEVQSGALALTTTLENSNLTIDGGIIE